MTAHDRAPRLLLVKNTPAGGSDAAAGATAPESAGRKILNSEYASGGETNEWKGTAELLVVAWLA